MGRILLVRHGQASFDDDDYDRLSPLGREQSRRLGLWLARSGLRAGGTWAGDMLRHRQTAEACLGALEEAPPLRIDAGFNEYDFREVIRVAHPGLADAAALKRHLAAGPDARRTFQALFSKALRRWADGGHDAEYTESWTAFRQRCLAALQRVAAAAGGREQLVFTSGGPVAAICQEALGLEAARALELSFAIVNASVTGVRARPGRVRLDHFNCYAHLEQGGEAALLTYR